VKIGEDIVLWIDFARRGEILGIDVTLTRVRLHGRNAFSDPMAQYRGGMEVLRHAFLNDPELGILFRRRALAAVCSLAGQLFLKQGQRRAAWHYFARAFGYWPLDRRALLAVWRTLVPQRVRFALRQIGDAATGSKSGGGEH